MQNMSKERAPNILFGIKVCECSRLSVSVADGKSINNAVAPVVYVLYLLKLLSS